MEINLDAFKHPQIRRLFIAQLLSQICDRLLLVSVLWVISSSPNPELAPWFICVGALPHLLLLRTTPAYISRTGSLKTVIGTDLIRGAIFLLSIPLFAYFQLRGDLAHLQLATLFVIYLLTNVFAVPFNSAILILPTELELAPELQQKATAMIEACFSIASVIAPLFSVLAYAGLGLPGVIAINGCSYLLAAWIEKGIVTSEQRSPIQDSGSQAQPKLGTFFVDLYRRDRLLPYLLGGFFILNLFLGPLLALIPLYAKHVYQGTLSTVGLLETALGCGTVAGALLVAMYSGSRIHQTTSLLKWVSAFLILDSAAYLAFCASKSVAVSSAALVILGFALSVANVLIITLFQRRALAGELPAIMSAVNAISVATLPLSMAGVGLLIKAGSPDGIQQIGIALALCAALSLAGLIGFPVFFNLPKGIRVRVGE